MDEAVVTSEKYWSGIEEKMPEIQSCLNALEGKIWKNDHEKEIEDEKSWKSWKSNPKSVMNEKLVQNDVMNEKLFQSVVMNENFVKNCVMNAQIDPNVVTDLSIFKIGGWNSVQSSSQTGLEEFNYENEPWLLVGIPSRDPFHVTQYLERHSAVSDQHMKKFMSLREGFHVMMQCYVRQHFADRYWLHEHPGGHAS